MKQDLPPLLVRADADAKTGTGHVMRCLALADVWKERGGSIALLSSCPETSLRRRYEKAGAVVADIGEPYPNSADLQAMSAAVAQSLARDSRAPWVALDGYHFDLNYQRALRSAGARLLVIDDTAHLARFDADIILNHALAAQNLDYRCSPDTRLLLGTQFALLRPEFRRWRHFTRCCPEVARKILITLGGSDNENVTLEIVKALEKLEGAVEIKVIAGPLYGHLSELRRQTEALGKRFSIETQPAEVASMMAWADLAIAAGGTTSWELAFMKVPTVVLTLADNQSAVAQALDEFGCARALGSPDGRTLPTIADAVLLLMDDAQFRKQMSERGRALIDGRGAERVVDVMCDQSNRVLKVRPGGPEDAVLLWQWANESSTRRNSFTAETIGWVEHQRWYAERTASNHARIWILEYGRIPVGQIRYERADATKAFISLSIAKSYRGRGLGAKLLELTAPIAFRELAVSAVEGIAFAENVASQRVFAAAGFKAIGQKRIRDHDCVVFRRSESAIWNGVCRAPTC